MFAFNVLIVTRGHSYKLYAKTSRIDVRHNFFFVNVSSRYEISLPASDCHFETFKSFKSF